jgi:hypothetical protein
MNHLSIMNPLPIPTPPNTKSIPIWIRYGVIACCLALLLPWLFTEDFTHQHIRTQGIMTHYTTSSTTAGTIFAPTFSFIDQHNLKQEITLQSYSSDKPFEIGESTTIVYLPTNPLQISLEHNPYQESTKQLMRLLSIPFFLLSGLFLLLRYLQVSPETTQLFQLITRFAIPWAIPCMIFIGIVVFRIHIPSQLHISGEPRTYTPGEPGSIKLLAGLVTIVVLSLWYLLQWPLNLLRILQQVKKRLQPEKDRL